MGRKAVDKNIWIFHHYATPPTMSGFTRPYNFGINLNNLGYKTKVFAASHIHFSNYNLIENNDLYIINNDTEIPFIFVKTYSSSENGIGRIYNMISYYKSLFKVTRKLISNNDIPDLIIASSPHPLAMIAGIKIAKSLRVPCICEIRDFWPEVFFTGGKLKENSLIGKILTKGEYWIYKNADALVFLKEGDYTYITDRKWDAGQGGAIDMEKCYYINNGVNIDEFNNQAKNETFKAGNFSNDQFLVVYTGAIRPVNNVANLLDTAKLLKDNKDIQFLIYGDGNQLESLQKRVVDEGITNLKMKGFVNKKYIPYILSKSSVNILNYSKTRYNWSRGNSSNKLFEYMAAGKPIISTVRMGYSIIDKYKCGIELENSTPIELAKAIMDIKNMKKEEYNILGKNAKQGVEDFDFKILTKRLIKVINDVKKEE